VKRTAYLFPLFPVITQTFTLEEVLGMKRMGYDIRIVSLLSRVEEEQQPRARDLVAETHYCPRFVDMGLWRPFLSALLRRPTAVLGLFATVISAWSEKLPTRESEGQGGPATFKWSEYLDLLYRGSAGFYLLKSLTMVPYAVYLAGYLRAQGIEHVHCQWATYPATVALLMKQWDGISYSISCHAYDIYLMPRMLPAKLENAEFVVTCADYNRQYLRSLCSPEAAGRIHLNYHGTDLERFRPAERVAHERFRLVSAGWLKEYKGFHIVLEAVAALVARGVDVEFHLAGDGPQREFLEKRAEELGISDRVVLHGYLSHQDLGGLYQQSDAFVIGSIGFGSFGRQDVIPNVIPEAMAVGIPVVATRLGGIPEILEDGVDGLLVPQRNPEAMADALEHIYRQPAQARERADHARARILEIWDRRENLRELAAIFEARIGGGDRADAA
jgi:glycosyltransferase involved in cell wall biosynthesis